MKNKWGETEQYKTSSQQPFHKEEYLKEKINRLATKSK
jgi:hypothetical protein